jgi:hypothetical protein
VPPSSSPPPIVCLVDSGSPALTPNYRNVALMMMMMRVLDEFPKGSGCRVFGKAQVQKVKGNLHIAAGSNAPQVVLAHLSASLLTVPTSDHALTRSLMCSLTTTYTTSRPSKWSPSTCRTSSHTFPSVCAHTHPSPSICCCCTTPHPRPH